VAQACTIVIAASDLLPALKAQAGAGSGDVLTFSEGEALRALEEMLRRRPHAIAIERQFAATPRGAALINRIKADPALAGSELRIVEHDTGHTRILQRAAPAPVSSIEVLVAPDAAPVEIAAPAPLDQRGTRRAPRYRIAGDMSMIVDGNAARLVDLSSVGAQVISPTVLKPNQRVRIAMADDHGALRFNATIAWAFFEIPPNRGPQYRAGVNFVDADGDTVDAFCVRHRHV
jgi:hypothetical protein